MGFESRNSGEAFARTARASATHQHVALVSRHNAGALLALGAVLLAAALYSPSLDSLHTAWSDTAQHTYTHGYLIVAISLVLLLLRWSRMRALPAHTGRGAALALAVIAFAWLVALRAPIQIGHQAALPIIAWLAVYGLAGWPIARLCAFPLAYLYFAIPVWDYANGSLQALSIFAVRALIRITSIPAYFQGEIVEVPAGTFQIEDGCSGLHFLIVALALASLHGELSRCSLASRLKLFALAAACALLSNWLRIYVIILAGHLTEMEHYLVRVDHYYFGWVVFVIAMACFFWIGSRWTQPFSLSTIRSADDTSQMPWRPEVARRIILILVLCAVPLWHVRVQMLETPLLQLSQPPGPVGWSGPHPSSVGAPLLAAKADAQRSARYEHDGYAVDVHVSGFASQAQGKKISGYGAEVHGANETVLDSQVTSGGKEYMETRIENARGQTALLWTRYVIGDTAFATALPAQVWYGLRSLFSMPTVRVVSLRSACTIDCEQAREALSAFAAEFEP